MKYLVRFNENKKYDIEDIKSCFVELEDEHFTIGITIGYLKFTGRHFNSIDNGIRISVEANNRFFLVDEIIETLEVAQEYIEETYNVKLDFIAKMIIDEKSGYEKKLTVDNFDKIGESSIERIYIYFRPVNTLDKVKNYIKSKL
jgi:hypothetical protein